jgi:hypothetical protein
MKTVIHTALIALAIVLTPCARALFVTQDFSHSSSFTQSGGHMGGSSFAWDLAPPSGSGLSQVLFSASISVTATVTEYHFSQNFPTVVPRIDVFSVVSLAGVPQWFPGAAKANTSLSGAPVIMQPGIPGFPAFGYSFTGTLEQTIDTAYTSPSQLAWFAANDAFGHVDVTGSNWLGDLRGSVSVFASLTYVYSDQQSPPQQSIAIAPARAPDAGFTLAMLGFSVLAILASRRVLSL